MLGGDASRHARAKELVRGSRVNGPVAQWIRHRPTEPGIAGSAGLEPQTLRLLAVRSNQLSYETLVCKRESRRKLVAAGGRVVHRKGLPKDGCPKPFTLDFPECVSNQKSCCPRMRFQPKELLSQNASPTKELLAVKVVRAADAGRKPVAAKG